MKKIMGIVTIFFTLTTFGQENPWEKKTNENPWITIEKDKQDSTNTPTPNSILVDTLSYKEFSTRGYSETKATGAFASGLFLCSLFNVFGAIPPLFAIAIPTPKELKVKSKLINENNNVSEKQIKEYKNGMVKKRFKQTLKGSGIGILINTTIIYTILKLENII